MDREQWMNHQGEHTNRNTADRKKNTHREIYVCSYIPKPTKQILTVIDTVNIFHFPFPRHAMHTAGIRIHLSWAVLFPSCQTLLPWWHFHSDKCNTTRSLLYFYHIGLCGYCTAAYSKLLLAKFSWVKLLIVNMDWSLHENKSVLTQSWLVLCWWMIGDGIWPFPLLRPKHEDCQDHYHTMSAYVNLFLCHEYG